MSWYKNMKAINFRGFKSFSYTIPKADLNELGVFFPLTMDFSSALDVVLGQKAKEILGEGNFNVLNYQFWDFMWESIIWPNMYEKYDDLLLASSTDVEVLFGVTVLHIEVQNEYTDRVTERDNVVFFAVLPEFKDASSEMFISLGGFFSPVQELIFSNFNDVGKDSLFHELLHAIKRSGDDLLKDIMYGNTPEEVTEEILVHLVTDKFSSLSKLKTMIDEDIKISWETKEGFKTPKSLQISGDLGKTMTSSNTVNVKQVIGKQSRGLKINNKEVKSNINFQNLKITNKHVRSNIRKSDKGKTHTNTNIKELLMKKGLLKQLGFKYPNFK